MTQVDQTGPHLDGPDSSTTASFVDALKLGIYAFDTRDVMGGGEAARVMIAGCRKRQALRRIRRAGFRVHGWTTQLTILPLREASLALASQRVVMWRSHDPAVSGQWFTMPH